MTGSARLDLFKQAGEHCLGLARLQEKDPRCAVSKSRILHDSHMDFGQDIPHILSVDLAGAGKVVHPAEGAAATEITRRRVSTGV